MRPAGYINGEYVYGEGEELLVENPSDGSEVARFRGVSQAQAQAAILAARTAFDRGDWSGLEMAERAQILHRFVAALEARSETTVAVLVSETGCPPHSFAFLAQFATPMQMAHEIIDLVAGLPEIEDNAIPPADAKDRMGRPVRSLRRYSPLGVVTGISAYNFPLHTGVWKVIPALAAGNTVILRPSPLTPLSAMAFAEAAEAVGLPAGVLNVVLESRRRGRTAADHASGRRHGDLHRLLAGRRTGRGAGRGDIQARAARTRRQVRADLPARLRRRRGRRRGRHQHGACRAGLRAGHSDLRARGPQGGNRREGRRRHFRAAGGPFHRSGDPGGARHQRRPSRAVRAFRDSWRWRTAGG